MATKYTGLLADSALWLRKANRMNKVAKDVGLGDRVKYLDANGYYTGPISDAIAVIGDTGGVAANDVVAVSGYDATTGYRKVKPADANALALARDLYFATAAIAAAATGYVRKHAVYASAIDLSGGPAVGDPMYLSTTAGAITKTMPTGAGTYVIEVGTIMTAVANGRVNIDLGGAERIMTHDHSDASQGGTLTTPALTGTTNVSFTAYSGAAKPRLAISGQAAGTGDFLMSLVPASTLTAGRTITFPDATDTVVTLAANQTLTTKTLTTPTIGDFTNANHDHSNAANGGAIGATGLTGTTNSSFTVLSGGATAKISVDTNSATGNFTHKWVTANLTADRVATFPDATGTVVFKDTVDALTNKTLTGCTLATSLTLSPAVTVTGTWTNLGAVTTTDINGGTIDGATLGATTPVTGTNIDMNGGSVDGSIIGAASAAAITGTTVIGNTLSAADATTPTITTATGKTNTGYLGVNGKTSGAFRITTADATAQTVTLTCAAQTVGAGTLGLPDMANGTFDLVLTGLAQTINGAKTFGSDINIPGALGTDASLGITGKAGAGGGAGGIIALAGGLGHTNGAGGAVTTVGGNGAGTGNGGLVSVTAGESGAGATGNGGAASLDGGRSTATDGSGGDVTVTGGASTGTGTGGDVTIASGTGSATGTGGAIGIDTGAVAGGGTAGAVTIGGTNAGSVTIGRATVVTRSLGTFRADDLTAGVSGTAGTIKAFPTTGAKGRIQITPQDNAADHLIDIRNASFGQASTLTIPDPGNAAASFVMNKGTNTLTSTDTHTGTLNISGATVTYRSIVNADVSASAAIARAKLALESKIYNIPLYVFKKNDLLTSLPAAGDSTNLGLVSGVHGTNTPKLQGAAANNNTKTETVRCMFAMPAEYEAGGTATITLHARTTPAATVSSTVDVQAYPSDSEAGPLADVVTTGAIANNSATWADRAFTVDGTSLVPGEILDVELTTVVNDTGGATNAQAEIGDVRVTCQVRG